MLNWPFRETSTLAVQGWGFWLAVAGMAVSVIGFAITLIQLYRTKRATTAVSDEIARIQFAVSKYDAVLETDRAEALLETVKKHIKDSEWVHASDVAEAFAKALHTLRELKVPDIAPHEDEIAGAMAHANRLCERLDKAGMAGLPAGEALKTLSTMRNNVRMLTSIRIALQRSTLGE